MNNQSADRRLHIEHFQPDAVAYRTLGEADASELTAARARLMAGLEGGGRIKAAPDAARAQVAYDCWLEAVEAKLPSGAGA